MAPYCYRWGKFTNRMSSINPGTIDSAAKGNPEAMRTLLNAFSSQISAIAVGTGVQLLEPTSGAQPQTPVTPTPPQVQIGVTGANGAYTISITPPSQTISATLYYEVSYSTASNFGNATVLPLTPSTGFTYNAPGTSLFWRVRASYDKSHFGAYSPAGTTVISAGLQSSAATENANVLNQTNYATVDSQANGTGSANVRVFGPSGPGFMYPAVKGSVETIMPSATIVNVPLSSSQVVAHDGSTYQVQPTLPQVLADGMTPTGSVSVVGSGAVTLPVITPIVISGFILGLNYTPGSGLTEPPILTIADPGGTGSGAVITSVVSGGAMVGYNIGNPGNGHYDSATTVTASGGTSGGTVGGGQAIGGNGGRLVYNDSTTGA